MKKGFKNKKYLFSDLIIVSRNQKCQKVEKGFVTPLDHCAFQAVRNICRFEKAFVYRWSNFQYLV